MQHKDLYFLDFYVPNDGEPDSALEIGVLQYGPRHLRPAVYLHSFILPANANRIRWNHAHEQGIDRHMILGTHGVLPTLKDLLSRSFLGGKEVVCLNPNLEPCKSFIRDAHETYGIIPTWMEVFAGDEEALKLLRPSQMLEYLGFPTTDASNTRYTALLARLHSLIAIWERLVDFKQNPAHLQLPRERMEPSQVWPIPDHQELNIMSVDSFEQVSAECVHTFFSERLPDYLDWYNLNIYHHDWQFFRKSAPDIQHLKGRKSMTEFLFNQVLSYRLRIWVLIFYALYERRLDYSSEIALRKGDFKLVRQSVFDDFSDFLILHLEEFLDEDQKHRLLHSIIHQALRERAALPYQNISFEEFERLHRDNRERDMTFNVIAPPNCSVKAFKEILENRRVLYRRYEISGDEQERGACITLVNAMFRQFLGECADPFSNYWTDSYSRHWISYIYGFAWEELCRDTSPSDADALLKSRSLVADIIDSEKEQYVRQLRQQLTGIVEEINQNIVADYTRQFSFMGASIDIVISKKQGSLFKRIFKL